MTEPQTVHDLGELGLLKRLFRYCSPAVVGDDAAVVNVPAGQQLVVTTDVLVEGVHFSDRTTSATDAGWRAVAANLSDLAAMGAMPLGVTVGLSLPGNTPIRWVDALYDGMAACLQQFGGDILGGDLTRADCITVAVTALGRVVDGQALYRGAACPGQAIVATGVHGLSRAGLALLLEERSGEVVPAETQHHWIRAHQRPVPRFDAISILQDLCRAQNYAAPIAAMDTSDGLANAVLQVCQSSGVGARIIRSCLPIPADLIAWVGEDRALEWTLYGGEDFELVLCLASDVADALVSRLGAGAAIIGYLIADPVIHLQATPDAVSTVTLSLDQGFQHF